MQLVQYGIKEENSDIRAHVCYNSRHVYVYATAAGIETISQGQYRHAGASQHGTNHQTAKGYLVPPDNISGCKWYLIPNGLWRHSRLKIERDQSTAEKGDRATLIVAEMLRHSILPLVCGGVQITMIRNTVLQVQGIDLSVHADIQVKCDLRGGHKAFGGTGNLFLQTHECNPFKQYGEYSKDRTS